MRKRRVSFAALASALVASSLCAQVPAPFEVRMQQGTTAFTVTHGSTVAIAAEAVGQPVTTKITLTYRGNGIAILTSLSVLGSTEFRLVNTPVVPFEFSLGRSASFDLIYVPTSSVRSSGTLTMSYSETLAAPGGGTSVTPGAIAVSVTGTLAEISLAYTLPTDGNVVSLGEGVSLRIPATPVGGSTTATLIVVNRGTANAMVDSIGLEATDFQLQSLPLLPSVLEAGRDLRVGIRYAPRTAGVSTGKVVVLAGARRLEAVLEATGSAANLITEYLNDSTWTTANPNVNLNVADTAVGAQNFVTFRVTNSGQVAGSLNSLSVTGAGLALSEAPIIPASLAPGEVQFFSVAFTPMQAGVVNGHLRVGSSLFPLRAVALGSLLRYSYPAGDSVVELGAGGSVLFSPISAGQSATLPFTIRNTGTSSGTVISIGLEDPRAPFQIEGLPPLPLAIAPNSSVTFPLRFRPTTAGLNTGVMRIDSQLFALSAIANVPPPMPSYRITGPSGVQSPSQQAQIAVELESAYPLALTGILTLTTRTDTGTVDPAVQFESGGRTVPFTIPANTQRGIFANGSDRISMQTGTTAGEMTITAAFALSGGSEIASDSPGILRLSVPAAPPVLLGVQLGATSANTVTLNLTGLSTTRSVRSLEIDLTTASGWNTEKNRFTIDVGGAFSAWYQNPQSNAFGTLFTASVPITIVEDGSDSQPVNPLQAIRSFTVKAINDRGSSAPVQMELWQ